MHQLAPTILKAIGNNKMKIKSRHQLRKDEVKAVVEVLRDSFGVDSVFFDGKKMEMAKTDEFEFILIDGEPMLFHKDGKLFLTVRGALNLKPQKKIVVIDPGAVKFVSKGADVMCPGIVEVDPGIKPGDFVVIVEQTHRKALAIGEALMSGDEMKKEKGKAVKSIHYVGDKIWNAV